MTPERWQQVEDVYHTVMARPERERAGAVAELCSSDEALGNEVKSLLGFLETPALGGTNVAGERPLVGRRFGSYSVRAPLGVGGMGEVYRAHDERLGRDVAIKILPRLFSSHPERLARFEREARMLAALNHPHIGAIYGLEEVDGIPALVLELVEGDTLAERIAKHAGSTGSGLLVHDALTIARQIAGALEAAHERGIIHRDLKPANIKITPGGVVKVLDLGLAKLGAGEAGGSEARLTESPTVSAQGSRDGLILGTIAYMSPEQAAGEAADKRSDLWAFGVVLLEMLTGRPVFTGETELDVLATVLKAEPDWTTLPAETPAPIRELLKRCLEKDRTQRLDSATAARLEIDATLAARSAETPVWPMTPSRRVALVAMAAVASVALVTTIVAWILMRPAPPAPVLSSRFPINTAPAQPLNVWSSDRDLAISPDGRHFVYRFGGSETAGSPLMVRGIGQLEPRPMAGITNAYTPFFSPDSQWIGFFENGELKKVAVTGGRVSTLCRVMGLSLGASWGVENTIVFATDDPSTGLWRVSADGGEPRVLTKPDVAQSENDHVFPSVLPSGRGVLFTIAAPGEGDKAQLAVLDSRTGQWQKLVRGGSQAEYVDSTVAEQGASTGSGSAGHLIYAAAGRLRALRFDAGRLRPSGNPVTLDEHVVMKPSGAANYAVSRAGTLIYIPSVGDPTPTRSLVWVNRKGHEEKTNVPPGGYGPPRLSPDNTRLAITVSDPDIEIAIWDFARETLTQLTSTSGMDGMPLWAPDSQRIIFMSDRERAGVLNLYSQPADGSADADRLTRSENKQWPTSIHESRLFGFEQGIKQAPGVILLHLTDPSSRSTLDHAQATLSTASTGIGPSPGSRQILFEGSFPEISPNGRYLAYQSEASGQVTVDVRPFPDVNRDHWQVSTRVGTRPAWAPNGRELFYLDESGAFNVVPVETSGPTFVVKGSPVKLFDTRYVEPNPARHYDVSLDGRRFLMIKETAADPNATPANMVLVEHWMEELKERVR